MYFYGWRQSLLFHCFRIREGYHNDLTALHGCFDMAYDAVLFGDIPGNVFKELFQQDLRLFYILAGAPFQRNNTGLILCIGVQSDDRVIPAQRLGGVFVMLMGVAVVVMSVCSFVGYFIHKNHPPV